MLWGIFAIVSLAFEAVVIIETFKEFDGVANFDLVDSVVSPVATLGVILLALKKKLLPTAFWQSFTIIYGVWAIIAMACLTGQAIKAFYAETEQEGVLGELIIALTLLTLFYSITWLGVRRYAQERAGPTSPPSTPETASPG